MSKGHEVGDVAWITRSALNAITSILIRERQGDVKHTQRRHDTVVKAEIGVLQQRAKECQKPPETERGCAPANTLILGL